MAGSRRRLAAGHLVTHPWAEIIVRMRSQLERHPDSAPRRPALAAAPSPAPHVVAVLALPGAGLFELAIVAEVFGLPRPELDFAPYELRVCQVASGSMPTLGGLSLDARHGLETLDRADTVVVPSAGDVDAEPAPELLAALGRAYDRGARLVSICSGAFVLAAAGLLDGRRATTHWLYAPRLARRYPLVEVDPDVLYVGDDRVITSAGSAAGIDVCLELVRRDHGSAVANAVARRLVAPPHRDGGQAQFVEMPMPTRADDDRLARVIERTLARLEQPVTVEQMARDAFMSVRTFTRRFRRATGMSPGRWLLEQRVRASLPLLESSEHSIEEVATLVGFATAASFRHHFAARMQTSPSGYRRAFQQRAA
jgi:AraC family transcriptional activator FtrA